MGIVYDKFWNLCKERGVTTYRIKKEKIITEPTLQKLRHNQCIRTDSIAAICKALNCQPGDIMEYVPDEE